MSWHAALGRFLFHYCFYVAVPGFLGCEIGPAECTFQYWQNGQIKNTLCGWNSVNLTFYRKRRNTDNRFLGLRAEKLEGELTSRTACSTNQTTFCLTFQYYFKTSNAVDLYVSVKYEGSDKVEPPLWKLSSGPWPFNYAQVPINTDRNFQVVFKADRLTGYSSESYNVFIDDILYSKWSCSLFPPAARPPTETSPFPTTTVTATAAPPATPVVSTIKPAELPGSTPTATSTTEAGLPTSTVTATSTNEVGLPTSTVTATSTNEAGLPTSTVTATSTNEAGLPTSTNTAGEPSQPTDAMIIGVVVAVVVVIIIVVVVVIIAVILLRRKRRAKEAVPGNARDKVAYSLGAGDPHNRSVFPVANPAAKHLGNGRSSPAGNSAYDNVTQTWHDPSPLGFQSTPVYANTIVQQPHPPRVRLEKDGAAFKVRGRADDVNAPSGPRTDANREVSSDYDVPQEGAPYERVCANPNHEARDDYELARVVDEGHETYSGTCDTTGDYNRLDFDGKSFVDGTTSEAAADCDAYNHLGGQEQDPYHHTDMTSRTEVIDNDYSHLGDQEQDTYHNTDMTSRTEVIDNDYSHLDDYGHDK